MRYLPFVALALALVVFSFACRATSTTGILVTLASALSSWPAAALAAPRVAGAGPRDLTRGTTLRWAGLFPSLVLSSAALVLMLAGARPWWPAPLSGCLLALGVFLLAARLWLSPLRPIFALRAALGDEARAKDAAERLVRSFEAPPHPTAGMALRRKANRAIAAAAVLMEAQLWAEALRVLATFPLDPLDSLRRATCQGVRAVALIYTGRRNEAWTALKDASAHARAPELIRSLALTDALLSALDGHADDAERRLGEVGELEDPRLLRALLIAKSHLQASRGDVDSARATLAQLAEVAPDGLARVIALAGPASAIARTMADEAR